MLILIKKQFLHSIYLNVEGWRSCTGSLGRNQDVVLYGKDTYMLGYIASTSVSRRNKSINRLNASLSEAIKKHVHMFGSGEVLGEFLGELSQVLVHLLLVCPLLKVALPPYWLLACRKNTGIHKHNVMPGRETHRSLRGLFASKMSRVMSILVGHFTFYSHPMSLKVSKKSWLMETE